MSYNKGGDEPRVNKAINSAEVRLIDGFSGDVVGVLPIQRAIQYAEDLGVDLVEIVPNATPPVCKAMDYGKYKYEKQKKLHEARKKQKTISLKEVKLRPNIDTNDLSIKLKRAIKFLEEGDKVKISMRFRGREMAHKEIGMEVISSVREQLEEHGKIEVEPKSEGMQVMMVFCPK